jgi:hypothetical protein
VSHCVDPLFYIPLDGSVTCGFAAAIFETPDAAQQLANLVAGDLSGDEGLFGEEGFDLGVGHRGDLFSASYSVGAFTEVEMRPTLPAVQLSIHPSKPFSPLSKSTIA